MHKDRLVYALSGINFHYFGQPLHDTLHKLPIGTQVLELALRSKPQDLIVLRPLCIFEVGNEHHRLDAVDDLI